MKKSSQLLVCFVATALVSTARAVDFATNAKAL